MAERQMPKFEKSSEAVVLLFRELTNGAPGEPRKMFGYPALFLNGNMVCGTFGQQIFFRFDPGSHESLKKEYLALKDFSPLPGRVSKGSLAVEAVESNREVLKVLLSKALSYAQTLPQKQPKKKAKS